MTRKEQKLRQMKKVRQTNRNKSADLKARAINRFLKNMGRLEIPAVPQKASIRRTLGLIRIALEAEKNG